MMYPFSDSFSPPYESCPVDAYILSIVPACCNKYVFVTVQYILKHLLLMTYKDIHLPSVQALPAASEALAAEGVQGRTAYKGGAPYCEAKRFMMRLG